MQNIINTTRIQSVMFMAVFALACLFIATPAHAADLFGGGSVDVYPDQYVDVYPDQYSSVYPDQYSSVYPDQYSYSPSYSTPSYSTSGYSTGGYSTGGYSTGGGYTIGTPIAPHPILYPAPVSTPVVSTPSNTYAPTTVNTNTCTGNSCNSDDHSVVNITNPAPVINNNNVVANYAQPVAAQQQYCANGYYGTYPNCYRNTPPVAYNNAPYVSLSQVPYTGLELGFWGSIAYWGAFVLFALFAAYLIAIKRVQNNIANYLKAVLFGTDEAETLEVTTETAPAPAPEATQGDMIDSFIMSQINRARHA